MLAKKYELVNKITEKNTHAEIKKDYQMLEEHGFKVRKTEIKVNENHDDIIKNENIIPKNNNKYYILKHFKEVYKHG